MSWREDKAEKLQKSRDFSFLQDGERQKEGQRSRQAKATEDQTSDKLNQEGRDRLLRLKALERQRAEKQKKHHIENSSPDERNEHKLADKNPVSIGNKRVLPNDQKFGSFFGKVEKVVAKRIQDEQRAREISARALKQAEAEKPKPKAESRKSSDTKQSSRPSSGSGSKPVPRPQNPVTVKAQKLKDNRDYSFLFSEEPSKAPAAGERGSRQELNTKSKDSRDCTDAPSKQKSHAPQSQRPTPANNGPSRPSSARNLSSSGSRKPGASRPSSAGQRERPAKDSRQDPERRPEKGISLPPPRASLPSLSRNAGHGGPSSRGPASKLPLVSDRSKSADRERLKSSGTPKPTNHERPVSRDSVTVKSSSLNRVSQSLVQRNSQSSVQRNSQSSIQRNSQSSVQRNPHPASANGNSRDRVVQKSTSETRVSQSGVRVSQNGSSVMKRKSVGEPSRKPLVTAKTNDGRRVDRSRYGESDSEGEDGRSAMRKLVSGGPRVSQSAGPRVPQSSVGVKRKVSEPVRSRPPPPKESKRQIRADTDSEADSEGSESDDGGIDRGGISSIIQKLFRYNPNKYNDIDDEDDKNMETSFRHIQAEERRSAKLAREEDEREQEAIEREEREERLRKLKRQKMQ